MITRAQSAPASAQARFRVRVIVLERVPGQTAAGSPREAWTRVGELRAAIVGGDGRTVESAGPRAVAQLTLHVRWSRDWQQLLAAGRRLLVHGQVWSLLQVLEEPSGGTQRLLRLQLEAAR